MRRQASGVALVLGAAAAVCAGSPGTSCTGIRADRAPPARGWPRIDRLAAIGLVAALLVVTRFTPLVRMITEWPEPAATIVAMPLAAWIGGLFTWVRMRLTAAGEPGGGSARRRRPRYWA